MNFQETAANTQSNQFGSVETEPQFTILASIETVPFDNFLLDSQIDSRFVIQEKQQTFFIPIETLLYRKDYTMVFILSHGLAQRRIVKVGLSNDQFVEVVSGLSLQDTIVTQGNLDIEDGTPITSTSEQIYD